MRYRKGWIQWAALAGLALNAFVVVVAQDESIEDPKAGVRAVSEDGELSEKQLSILYAKTNLQLAELELKRALSLNEKRVVIPKAAIERLRSNLAVAKEQQRRATSDAAEAVQNPRLRHAAERLRLAKVDLSAAEELQKKKAISDWEFRRLRLKHDLAQLNLALMKHPRGYLTLLDQMQYQIDRLGEDYLSLEQRIAKLETNYP